MVKTTGVYGIFNTISQKVYIGSCARKTGIRDRFHQHRSELRKGNHHSVLLQRAWNKYGEGAFEFIVIEECQPDRCLEVEQWNMDYFKSYDPVWGYNISPTARNCTGVKHSNETRRKISEATKGKKKSQHMRDKLSQTINGRKLTDEWKANLSKAAYKRWETEDRVAWSQKQKDRVLTDDAKERMKRKPIMTTERKERLAISVEDLESHDHLELCQGRLALDTPFVAETIQRKDDKGTYQLYRIQAVPFNCTLLVAATLCDMIRSRDQKKGTTPTRIWIHRNTAWTKVAADAVFVRREGTDLVLGVEIFPAVREKIVYTEPYKRHPQRFTYPDEE